MDMSTFSWDKDVCRKCGTDDRLVRQQIITLKSGIVHEYYLCSTCNTRRNSKYRNSPKGAAAHRAYQKKYAQSHPERIKAWNKVKKIPKQPCSICGVPESHKHHPNPSEPLKVIFLCPYHHKAVHLHTNGSLVE